MLPSAMLKLADNEPYALIVDSSMSRLYVYKNMGAEPPQLVSDYYATQGKQGVYKNKEGDQRTPIGVYFIDGAVKQKLPDLYGGGALNMDYPNAWDRRLGRTGHGIWLHGTPRDTFARAPYASDGCVVVSNPDLDKIFALPTAGSMPIVVLDKLEFKPTSTIANDRVQFNELLDQWRGASLLSLNKDGQQELAARYSNDFKIDGYDKAQWLRSKFAARIDSLKISKLSMFRYPGEADMMVMRFTEIGHGAAGSYSVNKQLYWKKESRDWKIFMETTL